ncbi:hypothetical protein, partial [Caballeronia sp. AAUFL_F2_KS46]|uniref:hypothetical protein n=1 Tax=Caballeronia sp. AAUFL_F2_KS46 TaxID=2921780 RepID=UPI002027BED5
LLLHEENSRLTKFAEVAANKKDLTLRSYSGTAAGGDGCFGQAMNDSDLALNGGKTSNDGLKAGGSEYSGSVSDEYT